MTHTVGQLLAEALSDAGVTVGFVVPGESFLGVLEAMPSAGIRVVSARHEGGAAFMAEAHGQLTGRPGLALATRIVGASNLAIGVHTARANSTPMLVVIGGVQRRHAGREAFQDADVVRSVGSLAKWATEIPEAGGAREIIERAIEVATRGRPGPVLLAVPEDVLDQEASPMPRSVPRSAPAIDEPAEADVRHVLRLLEGAVRPVILAGAGVLRSQGTRDLVHMAELLQIPVISSWRRGDVFPNDHPLYLGMSGFGAAPSVADRLRAADAMLVIGCRLNEVTTEGYEVPVAGVPWAHVDLEPRGPQSSLVAPAIGIQCDASAFLAAVCRFVERNPAYGGNLGARQRPIESDRAAFIESSRVDVLPWGGPGVHPGRVVAAMNELLPPETIVTTDAGNFHGWAVRGYRYQRPGTSIGPTSGAMGYALPASIAAAIARPGTPVVALAGDGGFAMTMSELETAVRERVNPIAIVFDNQRYGTIRVHQEHRGTGIGLATELGPIDFAMVADALGARGIRVESDADFEPALGSALRSASPTVLHLRLDGRWKSVGRLGPS